ncbi:hypothetical protein CYMTET_32680, partial [Cymbomonas tetramitiformis]
MFTMSMHNMDGVALFGPGSEEHTMESQPLPVSDASVPSFEEIGEINGMQFCFSDLMMMDDFIRMDEQIAASSANPHAEGSSHHLISSTSDAAECLAPPENKGIAGIQHPNNADMKGEYASGELKVTSKHIGLMDADMSDHLMHASRDHVSAGNLAHGGNHARESEARYHCQQQPSVQDSYAASCVIGTCVSSGSEQLQGSISSGQLQTMFCSSVGPSSTESCLQQCATNVGNFPPSEQISNAPHWNLQYATAAPASGCGPIFGLQWPYLRAAVALASGCPIFGLRPYLQGAAALSSGCGPIFRGLRPYLQAAAALSSGAGSFALFPMTCAATCVRSHRLDCPDTARQEASRCGLPGTPLTPTSRGGGGSRAMGRARGLDSELTDSGNDMHLNIPVGVHVANAIAPLLAPSSSLPMDTQHVSAMGINTASQMPVG